MSRLLDRDGELAQIDRSLDQLVAGAGSIVVIEGEAGIGKTALLTAMTAYAAERSITIASARASELELEFGFGVIRQLMLPILASMPAELRAEMLSGPAHLARPMLGLLATDETLPSSDREPDLGATLHGLYWLTTNLAAREPLLISLDDAHWADAASLRFLAFLARRLEGLPILVALSVRTEDPGTEAPSLADLTERPGTSILRPRPLSRTAVSELILDHLGGPVDESFALACLDATGGVPFLVCELVAALTEDGVEPNPAAAAVIARLGPETVRRSTALRVSQIGDVATAVARGVAVLGPRAQVGSVAALCHVDEQDVVAAADGLVAARILRRARPLEFAHPILRTSIVNDTPPHLHSDLHGRAATLLAEAGADVEEIAAHLLLTEPSASAARTEMLIDAGASARARGAPDTAGGYLRRALEEPPAADQRVAVLGDLGRCELIVRDPLGVIHLCRALDATTDARDSARLALELGHGFFYLGDFEASRKVLRDALDDLGDGEHELAAELAATWAFFGYGDPRSSGQVRAELPRLRRLAGEAGAQARALNILLAIVTAMNGEHCDETRELVERGFDNGRLLEVETSDSMAAAVAVNALIFVDELERAGELADAMLADARGRGSVLGFIAASAHRGYVALRQGALAQAEAETRAALELATQHELTFTIPFTLSYLSAALLERGRGDEATALVEQFPMPPGFELVLPGASLREMRGRLRIAGGDRVGGIDDLRAAGDAFEAIAIRNPNIVGWRSALALAIAPADGDEAAALIATELSRARQAGSPRAIGIALRASGLIKHGDEAIPDLRDAAAVLKDSPARLEFARALTDLGAGLRRANHRSDAREPLRAGLALAHSCGAAPLAERARRELLACGARPRRVMLTGRDALTPSEQRIAELAALGESNREIAQALFVTPKTIENHLGRIYKKLGISSRADLSRALRHQQVDE